MNSLYELVSGVSVIVIGLGMTACTVDNQAPPALAGPSEFGLALTMAASPDHLPRDGSSQSVVTLTVRDASGRGMANQHVALSITPGATLTQAEVVTGATGQAAFGVVAPTSDTVISGNQVVVTATPVGTGDAANATRRLVTIGLTGTPNATSPTADFSVTPAAPEIGQLVTFDATATMDEGGPCLDVCGYEWNFDDGVMAVGRIVAHAFAVGRPYNVALTVTDASGVVVTLRKVVTPTTPQAPVVALSFEPKAPLINQAATFIADATPAKNHSIVRYEWDFGGGFAQGAVAEQHTFTTAGTFTVTVKVFDDLGQIGVKSLSLTVSSGVIASFVYSPTTPAAAQSVQFDAGGSTVPSGAVPEYAWNWGDGNSSSSSASTASHAFATANTYVVRLTVKTPGGDATTTQSVTVK